MSLLEYARSLGVTMGSKSQGMAVGYTTNEDAAERIQAAGGRITFCYDGEEPTSKPIRGWEVVISPSAEKL